MESIFRTNFKHGNSVKLVCKDFNGNEIVLEGIYVIVDNEDLLLCSGDTVRKVIHGSVANYQNMLQLDVLEEDILSVSPTRLTFDGSKLLREELKLLDAYLSTERTLELAEVEFNKAKRALSAMSLRIYGALPTYKG